MKAINAEKTSCDVLVVGGGVSGTVAAVAAARYGARTFLIEKEKVLGGIASFGLLSDICGLYLNGTELPAETLNQGILEEIALILYTLSPQRTIKRMGRVFVLPYSRFDLAYALGSLCQRESNLVVFLNAVAVFLAKKKGEIVEVSVYRSGIQHALFPKVVIDCTGEGDVSVMAGASFEVSSPGEFQLAGYTIRLKGLRNQEDLLPVKVPYHLAEAVKKEVLPPSLRFSKYRQGDAPDEGYCKLSIEGVDGAEREQKARELALKAHRYLGERLPSFKDSYIVETSVGVMDREGRRICGEFTLTEDDVLNARKFHDGVVKNSWPIEIWDREKGTVYKYLNPGEYYEIPFRCLRVKGISNLLCAGRCISVTREAFGSTRVMGTCMALGEQAGLAAAYRAKNGVYPDRIKETITEY